MNDCPYITNCDKASTGCISFCPYHYEPASEDNTTDENTIGRLRTKTMRLESELSAKDAEINMLKGRLLALGETIS